MEFFNPRNTNCTIQSYFNDFPPIFAQTNVIEASPDMHMESEKEWYFGNAEKERLGPYSYEEVSVILKLWKALYSWCTWIVFQ